VQLKINHRLGAGGVENEKFKTTLFADVIDVPGVEHRCKKTFTFFYVFNVFLNFLNVFYF